ncbi:MAG: Eco57I restriction-modification methylase domain-containing protein [Deltaproteobacteria bacterium]|jgi:hypothetical protein|nr:Eco57I restriction-modification methylase domain-containing protein [Deltaproteobacteria bacterium]
MIIEDKRKIIQNELDSRKNIDDRRRLGQFSTPYEIANNIIKFGLNIHKNKDSITFFDPAFGTGVFYSALLNNNHKVNIKKAIGLEIDPYYAKPSCDIWNNNNIEIIEGDFTQIDPCHKFNFIICNPPYVRHHLIKPIDKQKLKFKTYRITGYNLSGLAGLYCHFMLQSYQWLDENGISGWLIPSEFMDVNYGKEIKKFLLEKVKLLQIHRYNPVKSQFDDSLVSSAVVWFTKSTNNPDNSNIYFSFGDDLTQPDIIKPIDKLTLFKEPKWTRFPQKDNRTTHSSHYTISDYFQVKRGIATGCNDFFILTKNKIIELNLPKELFRPILPSIRYLKNNEIFADTEGNPILTQQLFLLNCHLPDYIIISQYPSLWHYLETGQKIISKLYLCSQRKYWYWQEQREPPLYVCTYMGRGQQNSNQVFKFILNHSKAIVTNSYLSLYPKFNLKNAILNNPQLKKDILIILNNLNSDMISQEGRIYGGGLKKIEPSELLKVNISKISELISDDKPLYEI